MSAITNKNAVSSVTPDRNVGVQAWHLLGEVLAIHRQHLPHKYVELCPEPLGPDYCRVVDADSIQQYLISESALWVKYSTIVSAYERLRNEAAERGKRLRNGAYWPEHVFAPLKLVMSESDRPLKVALSSEPIYPDRAKLATLRRGQAGLMAYVALGVINSSVGQYYYRMNLLRLHGKQSDPNGVSEKALQQIPISTIKPDQARLEMVATLAYQMSTISEASLHFVFDAELLLAPLRERMFIAVASLLALGETHVRSIGDAMSALNMPDLPNLFYPNDDLPRLPPVSLVANARTPIAPEAMETAALWERRVNASLKEGFWSMQGAPDFPTVESRGLGFPSLDVRLGAAERQGVIRRPTRRFQPSWPVAATHSSAHTVSDIIVENRE